MEFYDILTLVLAIAAIAISIYTYIRTNKKPVEEEPPEEKQPEEEPQKEKRVATKTSQVVNLPDFIIDRYLQRPLTQPIEIGYTKYDRLKQLRNHLMTKYGSKGESLSSIVEKIGSESLRDDSPENIFTYEISLALDEMGMMLMTGSIPLIPTLQLSGLQFVEDFALCRKLIEDKIRVSNTTTFKNAPEVSLSRVHAEWLSLIAIEYMSNTFSGEKIEQFTEIYPSPVERLERLKKIEASCQLLISDGLIDEEKGILSGSPQA